MRDFNQAHRLIDIKENTVSTLKTVSVILFFKNRLLVILTFGDNSMHIYF